MKEYSKRIDCIAAGLFLLSRHDKNGFSVTAEHDQIWAGPSTEDDDFDISQETSKKLEELGWFMDDDVGRWSVNV